jgi:hypothetical protein
MRDPKAINAVVPLACFGRSVPPGGLGERYIHPADWLDKN